MEWMCSLYFQLQVDNLQLRRVAKRAMTPYFKRKTGRPNSMYKILTNLRAKFTTTTSEF